MDSKKYWDEVVPDWVKDATKTGDVVTVQPSRDREIAVVGPEGEQFAVSLEALLGAYNNANGTDYRLDHDALDEYF